MQPLPLPDPSLIVFIGVSGSGKTTFARRHFLPTEILSTDQARALVADDENDQAASSDAFATVRFIAARRLARGKLTVIDATNVQPGARKPLLALARRHRVAAVAVVLDISEEICLSRNAAVGGRNLAPDVLQRQRADFRRSLGLVPGEGFAAVHVLGSPAEVDAVVFQRVLAAPPPMEQVDLGL